MPSTICHITTLQRILVTTTYAQLGGTIWPPPRTFLLLYNTTYH